MDVSIRFSDPTKSDLSAGTTTTMAISESSVGLSSEVNSPVSFAMTSKEDKVEELDEIMGNLDLGEAMDHSDVDQEDFTTLSGGVSSNLHQICVIITKAAEENNGTNNIVVNTQDNNPRSNNGKAKEKYMSPPKSGELTCEQSIMARRYLQTREEKF
jgi:hypothetical protein